MNKPNNQLDHVLTESIQTYLNTPKAERDVTKGAEYLLQCNRNRILYNNVLRTPDRLAEKVEYELKKHLQIRLDGFTLQEVVEMQEEVIPAAAEIITGHEPPKATFVGKRADHDSLPTEIKALYERGGELYRKIRDTYNTLKAMDNAEPCDRYEHLKVLSALDKEYREGWNKYDAYQPEPAPAESKK